MKKTLHHLRFPEYSILKDPVLRETFHEINGAITELRRDVGLKAARTLGRDVQLIEHPLWDAGVTKTDDKLALGYYNLNQHRCYARYHTDCMNDESPTQQWVRSECALIVSHEMIHHASGGGFPSYINLNEGITETLNHDPLIRGAIKETIGCVPVDHHCYRKERSMWSVMRKNEPAAAGRILKYYWSQNQRALNRELKKTFGTQICRALRSPKSNPENVINMINGRK